MSTGAWLGILALFVVAILGGLYVVGSGHTASVAGGTQVVKSNVTYIGSVACPTTPPAGGFPKLAFIASYQNQANNNVNTTAAVAYNVTQIPSAGVPVVAGATSASQFTYTNGTTQCGGTYQLTFGYGPSGGTFYPATTQPFQMGQNTTKVAFIALQKEAQLTSVQFSNTTTFGVTALVTNNVITPGRIPAASSTISNIYFTLNTGAGAYGGNQTIVYMSANTAAISNIQVFSQVNGAYTNQVPSGIGGATPSTYNSFTGATTYWFKLPPMTTWSSSYGPFQVKIALTSSFAGNTAINFGVNDEPGYVQNGQVSTPAFGLDPNSRADLGQALLMYGGTSESLNGIGGATSGSGPIFLK